MTVTWLNAECTEAIVTRGWLRKRQAHVVRTAESTISEQWRFASGRPVAESDWYLAMDLERLRNKELRRNADNRDWVAADDYPKARLMERRS